MPLKMIDNHAHSIRRDFLACDEAEFLSLLSESKEDMSYHVARSVTARQFLLSLKEYSGTESLDSYLKMRDESCAARLFESAEIDCLLVDTGFGGESGDLAPSKSPFLTASELAELAGVRVYTVLRLETLFEKLLRQSESMSEVETALMSALSSPELVALKTIRAYRGGLPITKSGSSLFEFEAARLMVRAGRIQHCPYYEHLFFMALEYAAQKGLPLQVHCGLGDDDALLADSNPLHLQPLLRSSLLPGLKLVLLHCYPFEREAAYLASLYEEVYMDLSLTSILVAAEFSGVLKSAFAAAPFSKILAGTDGHSQPESYWWAASRTRSSLSELLGQWVLDKTISVDDKEEIENLYLRGNAVRLYNLK